MCQPQITNQTEKDRAQKKLRERKITFPPPNTGQTSLLVSQGAEVDWERKISQQNNINQGLFFCLVWKDHQNRTNGKCSIFLFSFSFYQRNWHLLKRPGLSFRVWCPSSCCTSLSSSSSSSSSYLPSILKTNQCNLLQLEENYCLLNNLPELWLVNSPLHQSSLQSWGRHRPLWWRWGWFEPRPDFPVQSSSHSLSLVFFTNIIVVLFIMSTCEDSKASNISGKTLEEEVGSKIST